MPRSRKILALSIGLVLVACVLWVVHRSVDREIDLALAEAARPPDELLVVEMPFHRPAVAERGGAKLWVHGAAVNDGASFGGRLLAATTGGLVELGHGKARRVRDVLTGLPDHNLTSLAVRGSEVALGTRTGIISFLEGEHLRSLRIDESRHGAVMDLRWHRASLYAATSSGHLLRLTGNRAVRIPPRIEGGITSLVEGAEGLLAAGGDGVVYQVMGETMEVVARIEDGPQRINALTRHGDTLLVGTSTALLRTDGSGGLVSVRENLFVTALLSLQGRLLVATFDQGILVLEGARLDGTPRQRLLEGQRVDRLRLVDDRPMAFGPSLAAVIEPGSPPRSLDLPSGLASQHITALAFDDRARLWVGHFDEGVDVLDDRGEVATHLPSPDLARLQSVNALLYDQHSRNMLVATSHGVLEVSDGDVSVLDRDDGLIGEAVTALLVTDRHRVFATSQGITLAPRNESEMRSIYAFHGLPSNRVYALGGSAERLLAGTLGGLAELEGLRVRGVTRAGPAGLAANWCSAIATSSEGIYVGTTGGGVDLVSSTGVAHLRHGARGGRFSVSPGAMLLLDEVLLVGTLERGLLVYDRREGEWLDIEQPFPGAAVTALAADDEHCYLGTDRGLLRISRGDAIFGT